MRSLLTLVAVAILGASVPAHAQAKRVRVVIVEDEVIRGEVQKPSVQILIVRQDLSSADQLELQESFIRRIIKSVEAKPF